MIDYLKMLFANLVQTIIFYICCVGGTILMLLTFGTRILIKKIINYNKPIVQMPVIPPKSLLNGINGEHKYITANGIKFHYVEKGDPKKPLMLFVHGFPEFWYSWRNQIIEFSKDYWTIAIDLRGYSASGKPMKKSDYKIEHLTKDLECLIKAFGKEKCVLVCHDWGAVVGWQFVAEHMDMVSKYIMIGAASFEVWTECIKNSWKQFLMSQYVFFFQMPKLPELLLFHLGFDVIMNFKNFTKEDLEAFRFTYSHPGAFTLPLNYYRANINSKLKTARPKICSPGLYILGEKDVYTMKESGKMLMNRFENLQFEVIPNANHFVQQHTPEKLNESMRKFLSQK